MTRLDQAFIKAYSKKTTGATPPAVQASAPPRPHLTLASAGARPNEVPPPPLPPSASPDRLRLDAAHLEQGPHWRTQGKAAGSKPAQPTTEAGGGTASQTTAKTGNAAGHVLEGHAKSAGQHRSLASTAAERLRHVSSSGKLETRAAPSAAPPPRAAFEVDRFLWPSVCDRLIEAAPQAFDQVAGDLIEAGRRGERLLLVTSVHRGAGRTSLVVALARALSRRGARVALLDADFHQPRLARHLKMLPHIGWDEALRAGAPLAESWIESVADSTVVVPLQNAASTAGLEPSQVKAVLEALARQHDVVLVDAGPLEEPASRDCLRLLVSAARFDRGLVVSDGRCEEGIDELAPALSEFNAAEWQIVENFSCRRATAAA